MSVILALALQVAAEGRRAIGIYQSWGAFRDAAYRCMVRF